MRPLSCRRRQFPSRSRSRAADPSGLGEVGRWQVERAASPEIRQLRGQTRDVETPVLGPERLQSPDRLFELALGPDSSAAPGLVPGYGNVHEALEEVALVCVRGSPHVLQLFVRGEVLAAPDEVQPGPIARLELLRAHALLCHPLSLA